jgi:hypothetical protein
LLGTETKLPRVAPLAEAKPENEATAAQMIEARGRTSKLNRLTVQAQYHRDPEVNSASHSGGHGQQRQWLEGTRPPVD